jgi:hypothetical protein
MRISAALALATAAVLGTGLGFIGLSRTSGEAQPEAAPTQLSTAAALEGRSFRAIRLVIDGQDQPRVLVDEQGIAFAHRDGQDEVSVINGCTDFGSVYRVTGGRLDLLDGNYSTGALRDSGCLPDAPGGRLARRVEDFYLAQPIMTLNGTGLHLAGPGLEITFVDARVRSADGSSVQRYHRIIGSGRERFALA